MVAITGNELINRTWRSIARVMSAHVVMLRDVGLIDDDALSGLLRSIESTGMAAPPHSEGLIQAINTFDQRMDTLLPRGLAGTARVGRGTLDVAAGVTRMILREAILDLVEQLDLLRELVIELAATHVTTLLPVSVDGQVIQPTSFGHLLAGTASQLARAAIKFDQAFAAANVSPLGSVALASTGMPIDRERLTDLLAFDGLIENTLDAVSATDHFLSAADAIVAAIVPIRRFVEELLSWSRAEPGSLRFSSEWTSLLPESPQANPATGVQQLNGELTAAIDAATALRAAAARVDFGPIAGSAGHLLEHAVTAFDRGKATIARATSLINGGFEINRALLANRAGKGLSTSSDLADFLMIEEQIEPGPAQNIAALTISRAREMGLEASGITPELIDGAALLVIGREIKVEFEAISRYLAPRRFIERRVVVGGPNPDTVRAHLDGERARLAQDRQRVNSLRERIRKAETSLAEIESEYAASTGG